MFARGKPQHFCSFGCVWCEILPVLFFNIVNIAFFLLACQMMNYLQIHVSQITCHFTNPQRFCDTINIRVYSSIQAYLQIRHDCNYLDLSYQSMIWVKNESFLLSRLGFVCFFMSQDILYAVISFPLEITYPAGVPHFKTLR